MRKLVPHAVSASIRRPWLTLGLALAIAAAALLFTLGHFAMSTDTAELISPNVAWRQQERAMDDAFPQLRDSMVIVVDGATPELAEDGAAHLAERLGSDTAHFRRISRPDGGDFLAREGLLLGSTEDARQTTAALVDAAPLLGPLAADPSLRGVGAALSTMLEGVHDGATTLDRIAVPMRAIANATQRARAGKPAFFSWQRLFARTGSGLAPPTRRLILARPVLDDGSITPGAAAGDAVTAAAHSLRLDRVHGVRVRLTGEVPLSDEEFATLQDNIGQVGLVMLAAMLLTLWLATRSIRLVAAIVATIGVGLMVTLAMGLFAVGRLNLISIAFVPLFVGLGVDFGIQLCVRFNAEQAVGADPAEAWHRASAAMGLPLMLAAGAVFLGFGAFLPTAYVGIAELGVIAGMGMVIALGFSITMLPALVVLLRPKAPRGEVGFAGLAPVDRLIVRKRGTVLWAFAGSMAISIALLPWVNFDFNPLDLRDPNGPAIRTLTDLTHDPDLTPNTISVLAPDRAAATRLTSLLSALPEVKQVVSLASFIPDDQAPKLAVIGDAALLLDVALNPFDIAPPPDDAAMVAALTGSAAQLRNAAVEQDRLRPCRQQLPSPCPVERGLVEANRLADEFERLARGTPAQRAAVNAILVSPLSVMLDQARAVLQAEPISADSLPAELVRDWRTPDDRYRLEVFPAGDARDNRVLRRFRDAVSTVTPAISGLPVATQAAAATISGAFIQAGVIAFVLVSLLLFSALRNVREVAFTLAPVVLSIFLTLGTCVVIGQPINFANIIAFPLLFGVGVAFHIYFVMAWRGGMTDMLQSSLARAVLFSALATGTAFGSLWLSHHPGTASMGKILMISLAWTLVCALIFEPALLGPPRREVKV